MWVGCGKHRTHCRSFGATRPMPRSQQSILQLLRAPASRRLPSAAIGENTSRRRGYTTGAAATTRGRSQVRLRARQRIIAGRYTVTLTRREGRSQITSRIQVTIDRTRPQLAWHHVIDRSSARHTRSRKYRASTVEQADPGSVTVRKRLYTGRPSVGVGELLDVQVGHEVIPESVEMHDTSLSRRAPSRERATCWTSATRPQSDRVLKASASSRGR